ncbi:dynein assembly factor with WDR repeat domains 1 [Panthera uncia]|uniref:dynein assembly factor with WDR repeat domains 1 n=1 Tax=Panthera uncia TaxID=29064 RepID=UPI0020FF8DF8|nr:dynein assembly factor with WDR repeat domains 1 [Panthera uncia]
MLHVRMMLIYEGQLAGVQERVLKAYAREILGNGSRLLKVEALRCHLVVKCGKCDNTGVSGPVRGQRGRREGVNLAQKLGRHLRRRAGGHLRHLKQREHGRKVPVLAPCVQNMMILVGREESPGPNNPGSFVPEQFMDLKDPCTIGVKKKTKHSLPWDCSSQQGLGALPHIGRFHRGDAGPQKITGTLDYVEKQIPVLAESTDVNALVEEIQKAEPVITASRSDQVKLLLRRLQDKLRQHSNHQFYLFKVLRAHILPLTNVALNKSGSCFITGSYDRTCKLWDTASGEELHTLEGHRNVVYAIAFNNPYGDKIATGSFDKTCKLWSVETGKCYHTFRGHTAEIVCLSFNPQSTLVATGSMDTTAKLWDIQNGEEALTLTGHSAEIISLSFNTSGNRIITGSFDHTVAVWEAETGRKVYTLVGHCAEISSALFNWDCSLILTGSMDKTCMLWDAANGKYVATLTGHDDEILDSCFDYTGKLIATASADGTARVFSAATRKCIARLEGHEGEISKISFNPQGNRLLTGSTDKTARIWDAQTGQCLQVLEGHTDEIFSCAFNYKGNIIITGSKDNTCRIWR